MIWWYNEVQSGFRLFQNKFDADGDFLVIPFFWFFWSAIAVVEKNLQFTTRAISIDCLNDHGVAIGEKVEISFLCFRLRVMRKIGKIGKKKSAN